MKKDLRQIVLAGGCFWCTEAVFRRLDGVELVESGYTGGTIKNPAYREVCSGRTGHAEAVRVTFDPDILDLDTILEVFFATHDPTTLNRQGNDVGTQYRSAIFFSSEAQRDKAVNFIKLLEQNNVFQKRIVTEIAPLDVFYKAEADHQEYYEQNSQQPYCQFIIAPKLEKINTYYKDKLKSH